MPKPANAKLDGSGTVTKKPRISPPGNVCEWMFQYALPVSMALKRAVSAVAGDPPLAVMNAVFQLEFNVKSSVFEKDPANTPAGKPAKLGVVVATPAVPLKGLAVAAWMWDAVVPD